MRQEQAARDAERGAVISRHDMLKVGLGGAAGLAGTGLLAAVGTSHKVTAQGPQQEHSSHAPMPMPNVNGEVDHTRNGFNPSNILTDFDYGEVSTLPSGQTLRSYQFVAQDKTIEIAPGVTYPAWTYNGRIPGPTIRAREGDRLRIVLVNGSDHPHSIHFHGVHPAAMDGVVQQVPPGGNFIYEFDAEPFGVHLYHCHTPPLPKHISKGLYGAFIVDPHQGRAKADHEFVMVMNGIDVDFDDENDFYAINTIAFHYHKNPIKIKVGQLVRVFLVNMLEFDPINSFHLHANFFHYYPTGTSLTPNEYTDTIAQMQGQRGILEFRYKHPGRYMFHAHKAEFAELGWTGFFDVEG